MIDRPPTVAELHTEGKVLVVPCIWDAASARAAASAGAELIATTSAGVSWSLGHPDGQHMTSNELLRRVEQIAAATDLPISVDIEEGYSDDTDNVVDLVSGLLDLGVGGINIEDGDGPVGLLEDKIAAITAMAEKRGMPLFVNARTDVYLKELVPPRQAVEEAIDRGLRYVDAGASGVFVPMLAKITEISQVAAAISVPVNVMAVPGLPPLEELSACGVRRLSFGPWLSQAAYGSVAAWTRIVLATGQDEELFEIAAPFALLNGTDD